MLWNWTEALKDWMRPGKSYQSHWLQFFTLTKGCVPVLTQRITHVNKVNRLLTGNGWFAKSEEWRWWMDFYKMCHFVQNVLKSVTLMWSILGVMEECFYHCLFNSIKLANVCIASYHKNNWGVKKMTWIVALKLKMTQQPYTINKEHLK